MKCLALRKDVSSGNVLENCLTCYLPPNFGIASLWQYFQVDNTEVLVCSKSASLSTFKAGNVPVAPLVLCVVGDGDHLPSNDPIAGLPYLFQKKGKRNSNLHTKDIETY